MTAMVVQLKNGVSYSRGDEFIAGEWFEGGNETFHAAYKFNCEWYGKTTDEAKAAWFERKKKLAAQRAKDKKEGKSISESSSSSEDLEPEPKPSKKKDGEKEGSQGSSSKSPKPPINLVSSKRRGSLDTSSSDEEKKSPGTKKRGGLTTSSDTTAQQGSKSKPLSWFAQKFGGPTAREAIVTATGLVHTSSKDQASSDNPGTPKEGSQLGRSKPAKK